MTFFLIHFDQATSTMASAFDFVIVGGGTAGLVLAARLSEDSNTNVLVIEAGDDLTADPRVNVPAMWPQLQGTDTDWQLMTVPQVSQPRLGILSVFRQFANNVTDAGVLGQPKACGPAGPSARWFQRPQRHELRCEC